MWTPIFLDNAKNVITVLDTYVQKMQSFRNAIAKGDKQAVDSLIHEANRIKKVLLK